MQAETCMDRFLASATFRQWAKGEYDITSFFGSHWRMPVDLIYCLLFPEDSFIDLVIKQQMQSEATSGHRHGDLMRGLWFPMSQPSCFPPSVFHVFPETLQSLFSLHSLHKSLLSSSIALVENYFHGERKLYKRKMLAWCNIMNGVQFLFSDLSKEMHNNTPIFYHK